MKSRYGYSDDSGEYFIAIDTGLCIGCANHECIEACRKGLFQVFPDDYNKPLISVKLEFRKNLFDLCSECKSNGYNGHLPCTEACASGAIEHTW